MKKFKRIFYPIYLVMALGMIYFSFDSLINMEETRSWFDETFEKERQPYWIMLFFLIFALLMIVEMIAENVHIHQLKEGGDDDDDEDDDEEDDDDDDDD